MELPALAQVLVHVTLFGELPQLLQERLHLHDLRFADRGRTESRGEAFQAQPGGVDLLEVLTRQPADERPSRRAHRDEALALELAQPRANRRRGDAESFREIALDERRPLGQRAAHDQVPQRPRHPLLDRFALLERGDRCDQSFHFRTVCSKVADNAI